MAMWILGKYNSQGALPRSPVMSCCWKHFQTIKSLDNIILFWQSKNNPSFTLELTLNFKYFIFMNIKFEVLYWEFGILYIQECLI